MGRFEGRVALITGAGKGIGSAVAKRLAQEGAAVIAADIDPSLAKQTEHDIRAAGQRAFAFQMDVSSFVDVNRVPRIAEEQFGQIPDLVVCNAGVQTFQTIEELTVEEWDRVFNVNARGTFLTMQMAAKAMRQAGVKGSIVTIASIQGRLGSVYYANYSASKAAVISLTKSFALAYAPYGIRVNCVAPGAIQTELWERADREMAKIRGINPGEPTRERIAKIPLQRLGAPEDIASAVAMLLSDELGYVTGECLHVCGGDLML